MGRPWNDWYHCMGNTYGTWLYGDPRGFRTRHHREHIPYDYKHPPPPGLYKEKYERSQRLMPRPPVFLSPEQRCLAVKFFVASLQKNQINSSFSPSTAFTSTCSPVSPTTLRATGSASPRKDRRTT
ncbi:MAG: hypothetical protein ABSH20_11575 [Tepidisphaeraceae bacterium]